MGSIQWGVLRSGLLPLDRNDDASENSKSLVTYETALAKHFNEHWSCPFYLVFILNI